MAAEDAGNRKHFLRQEIEADIAAGRYGGKVRTRFPPEPNGYLHIGHAKSVCLNFGLAEEYGGTCNLRFDDTNPVREQVEYVESIKHDVAWLGFDWDDRLYFASDYFERMYELAEDLVAKSLAYVDDLSMEEIRAHRGTLTEPGRDSPARARTPGENLDLLRRMRAGEFPNGSRVLRAKIDMASPNVSMRDPVMYRILHARHHRTGDTWCIYPMYDWAHGLEDSIEEITHSICTLEFENHRPLYDWFLDKLGVHHPRQIEFARLALTYTVMSKRRLGELVERRLVRGWDDPRMPTISGLRRRGYTPESVRAFCEDIGVTRFNAIIDVGRLENSVREHLNRVAPRRMCVLRPLKVVIENWADGGPEDRVEEMPAVNNPEDPGAGTRPVLFTRELYIERDDFMLDPPKKFFRLGPGREVRLRYGYWITCREAITNDAGEVVELRCTYDPETRGGESPPDGRKVKGTLHWVSASRAVGCEVRLFDRLFNVEQPDRRPKDAPESWTFLDSLNPDSLEIVTAAKLEPAWDPAGHGPDWPDGIPRVQFERHGYFCLDPDSDPAAGRLVWNRTAGLRDSWAKVASKGD